MVVVADKLTQTPSGITDVFVAMAERLRQSTVLVRGHGPGGGSGVIWSADGLIITNAHLARGPRVTVELADGRTFAATVTARDEGRDLASLQIAATGLPAPTIGDSDMLRVGALVLAVGNPLGLNGALTTGVVHAAAVAAKVGRGGAPVDVQITVGERPQREG